MSTEPTVSAEIRIDVRCKLDDETPIPDGFCVAVGDPDEDGYIEYTLSGPINTTQLQQIYNILKPEAT